MTTLMKWTHQGVTFNLWTHYPNDCFHLGAEGDQKAKGWEVYNQIKPLFADMFHGGPPGIEWREERRAADPLWEDPPWEDQG